jgi:S-DNA-T family DNA segregation ATPase FtsK/SpoIIIE
VRAGAASIEAAAIPKSDRAEKERQVQLFEPPQAGELPALGLLDDPRPSEASYSAEALEAMSRLVELKLKDFGVDVEVVAVHPGPVITRFEMRPAPGVTATPVPANAPGVTSGYATAKRDDELLPYATIGIGALVGLLLLGAGVRRARRR